MQKLKRLLQTEGDSRVRERLRLVLRATSGRDTLEDLARRSGRSRSTVQNWLLKFEAGGIDCLLERHTPPGMVSPLAGRSIQARLKAGIQSGRWRSAGQIAEWLEREHGIKRSRKSIYYWMHKLEADSPNTTRHRKA